MNPEKGVVYWKGLFLEKKLEQVNTPSYYAVIPANVRYDELLPPNAKLLYGEITALCSKEGYCWASNEYFSNLYHVTTSSISSWVSALSKREYVTVQMIYREGTKEILNRYIRITAYPIPEISHTPIPEISQDSTTSLNTTLITTSIKKEKPFNPEAFRLSNLLFSLHKENIDPGYKVLESVRQKWATDIEKIIRIDGRDPVMIEAVIRWVKHPGQFWAPNIMSGSKLREKYSTLLAQMSSRRPDQFQAAPKNQGKNLDECDSLPGIMGGAQ